MPAQGVLPLKAGSALPNPALSSPSTEATLQSLYNRAARAFLHRDVVLTTTLVASAFAMLQPPVAPASDALNSHRRKWDILRITLESTVYSSPPDRETLPTTLREILLSSPQTFVITSHARSLILFTPSSLPRQPTSAFLPHQVLITLVASSMKVDCPALGREMTEDWLSNRGQYDFVPSTGEAYEKVLELYCLHVLPRLGEWDYAKEFLRYESELSPGKRTEFQTSMENLQAQALKDRAIQTPTVQTPAIVPQRSPSPAPSTSSSSSSLSTISNRTAVPLFRSDSGFPKLRQGSGASSISITSDATVTRRSSGQHSKNHTPTPRADPSTSVIRSSRIVQEPLIGTTGQPPGTLALIKESLRPYLTANRLATLSILFLLLPLVSYSIRLRRMRAVSAPQSTADQVKRRLFDTRRDSVLSRLWNEVIRAILDTVRMGGGGLV
ncbi:hypothetical protein PAXINDRAFT_13747 [Paxillus involutus ATCC 200175]|uniref:Unplaced genomic scaffold PAXINscaffold_30, whole genome shotgun sequence n=1 Tax=Paxillus involutus ATCC 200175 TaxID=664439 RepID=A0A0C9SVJ7_PAXIN|nr:hypothetical protein PAXINDRAFT_13747 [Paxillus involutus ATCC 200175]